MSDVAAAQGLPQIAGVSNEISIGVMRGKAQEYVFNANGSTLSRLDWTFDNVAMFNTRTSIELMKWLRLGARTSFNLSGNAFNKDFDFNLFGCPSLECRSESPTNLTRAHMLDLHATAKVIGSGSFTVSAIAGYKRDDFRWQAIGGTANYTTLPPGIGISYEQTWSTPYLGLGVTATSGSLSLAGRVIASNWAKGEAKDDHHLRSLVFSDTLESTKLRAAEIGVAYRFNPYLSLTADYRYQKWGTGKGPTKIADRETNATTIIAGDAAGADAVSHMVSLGLKVDLQPAGTAQGGLKDAPAVRPPAWTGWSVGAMAGLQAQRDRWTTERLLLPPWRPPLAPETAKSTFDDASQRAGLFLGYSWRTAGGLVWGIEGDVGKSNTSQFSYGIPGIMSADFLQASQDVTVVGSGWDGSVRLRAGMSVLPSLLVFGTGGIAFQEVKASLSCPGRAGSVTWCGANRFEEISKTKLGWTAGVGYEWAFAGSWFTRGEYRYSSFAAVEHTFFANSATFDDVVGRIDPSNHRLTFGLGYRF